MEVNIFEKIGKKIRKDKLKQKDFENKYWKLPAAERLHYDSIKKRMEDSQPSLFWASITSLKLMVIIPLFFVFLGYMLSIDGFLVEESINILKSLIKLIPVFMILDFFAIIYYNFWFGKNILKINNRFKLIK